MSGSKREKRTIILIAATTHIAFVLGRALLEILKLDHRLGRKASQHAEGRRFV